MKETKFYKSVIRFISIMKPMKWSERIEYVFMYYKELVFVVSIALIVIIGVVGSMAGNNKQIVFGGLFANVDINKIGYSYLTDGVAEFVPYDPDKQQIKLTSTAFDEASDLDQLNYTFNAAMSPIAMIEKGELHYMVMDEEAMKFYMSQYALMDLTEIFDQSVLDALGEDVIYIELQVEQVRYPIAINITDLEFSKDCLDVSDPIYLGFTGTKENKELFLKFWNHLNNWKGEN